ncbi:O-methyltransferase family 3 protein [Mycena sanguinolenta]|uniref:O-methyltransferase family 3 protein n=1 Tax=Mycena sanguinolenta TaxID=230812 RepID=A0A8H6Z3Z2_9AGAR|nr:O-methyltransferase family 3 protein [Mycena sanguinolenta]
MPKDYFEKIPPELILQLSPSLSTASLNALALTCRRLHTTIQPDLETRITPELARKLLLWAAAAHPHIVAKLLSPPHSLHPDPGLLSCQTPLHVAAKAGNLETAQLLLDAGASPASDWGQDEYQPLHLAVMNKDVAMTTLLLDRGAPLENGFGCDGGSETALQHACWIGHLEIVKLLVERGANIERSGHYGTALGFAVHGRKLDVVRFLLEHGANAKAYKPLYVLLVGGPPPPLSASLLYSAMGLRAPGSDSQLRQLLSRDVELPKWVGLPLKRGKEDTDGASLGVRREQGCCDGNDFEALECSGQSRSMH